MKDERYMFIILEECSYIELLAYYISRPAMFETTILDF